jgi:predicted DNA-binding transcriptional regulator YafY
MRYVDNITDVHPEEVIYFLYERGGGGYRTVTVQSVNKRGESITGWDHDREDYRTFNDEAAGDIEVLVEQGEKIVKVDEFLTSSEGLSVGQIEEIFEIIHERDDEVENSFYCDHLKAMVVRYVDRETPALTVFHDDHHLQLIFSDGKGHSLDFRFPRKGEAICECVLTHEEIRGMIEKLRGLFGE